MTSLCNIPWVQVTQLFLRQIFGRQNHKSIWWTKSQIVFKDKIVNWLGGQNRKLIWWTKSHINFWYSVLQINLQFCPPNRFVILFSKSISNFVLQIDFWFCESAIRSLSVILCYVCLHHFYLFLRGEKCLSLEKLSYLDRLVYICIVYTLRLGRALPYTYI